MTTDSASSLSHIKPELLLAGYASGFFPMAEPKNGEIRWFSPDPRGILPLDSFKISRSLHQVLRKNLFEIRYNTSFEEVIRACGGRGETWISEEIIQSYIALHKLGYGHSVEAWIGEKLAGGLYGVALGAAFFGESMFSRVRDSSKVALVHLVGRLKERQFELLDTQFSTPHLSRFGVIDISRDDYLILLQNAVHKKRSFTD
jgi:leucyl/phenylalanyl-tRNA---protein transferase